MSRAKEVMLQIVSGLSANMAAGPLAAVLGQMATGASGVGPAELALGDLTQCAAYGTLFAGATFLQICRGKKAEHREAVRMQRLAQAVRRLADSQDDARQELADLALEQQWVREALEHPDTSAAGAFNAAWRAQVAVMLKELNVGTAQTQATLAELAHLEFDTNWRVREVQAVTARTEGKVDAVLTEQQRQSAAIEQLAAQIASMQSRDGMIARLQGENNQLNAQIAAVTERYIKTEEARGRLWRDVIEELRHDPKKLGEFLDTETDRTERDLIEQHRERAVVYLLTGQISKAEMSLRKITTLSPHDLEAINKLGYVALVRSDFEEAEKWFRRICDHTDEDSWRAVSLGNLGLVEKSRGNLRAAIEYLKEALSIEDRIGLHAGMADTYNNLGIVEQQRGDYKSAKQYYETSLAIEIGLNHKSGIAQCYCNLGSIMLIENLPDDADKYFTKAIAVERERGHTEGIARLVANFGLTARARGEFDLATTRLQEAMVLFEQLGAQESIAICHENLGSLAFAGSNHAEALRLWRLARDIFRKIGARLHEHRVQSWLNGLGE